jgi:hypothetical protein
VLFSFLGAESRSTILTLLIALPGEGRVPERWRTFGVDPDAAGGCAHTSPAGRPKGQGRYYLDTSVNRLTYQSHLPMQKPEPCKKNNELKAPNSE